MCNPNSAVPIATGSRRRRLWDLPQQCHCPVVGVCFPLPTLRQQASKILGSKATDDDYHVHVRTVAQCAQRNRLSELLQKDLETRYALVIHTFRAAKCATAVVGLWADAKAQGDVSGAFWAALTHPRCDEVLQEFLLRDMHMLQHQAGAAVRVDMHRFNDLIKENGVLARELGRVQERCTRVISEKCAEIEHLNAAMIHMRATVVGKDTQIAFLAEDLRQLKASIPEYEQGARLLKKVDLLSARVAELETQNSQLRVNLGAVQRASEVADANSALAMPALPAPSETPITLHLQHKTVLCVGGRHGNVANYRDIIEKAGGHFAHHDGGLEDNPGYLDSSLAAADLVICQTGCINHNAYWRVKDFCKRHGKQCVFVENPSTSSLARCLRHVTLDEAKTES